MPGGCLISPMESDCSITYKTKRTTTKTKTKHAHQGQSSDMENDKGRNTTDTTISKYTPILHNPMFQQGMDHIAYQEWEDKRLDTF